MNLFQIFLPVADNNGKAFGDALLKEVRQELTEKFEGLTAYSRSPAEGVWQDDQRTQHEDMIILEVMSPHYDAAWWSHYRGLLEERFRQKEILIRRQTLEIVPRS